MAKVSSYKPLDKNISVDIYLDDKCVFYAEFSGKRYEASSIVAIKKILKDILSQWTPTLEWIKILEITNNRYSSSLYTDVFYIARGIAGAWMRINENYSEEERIQHMHSFSGIPIAEDPPYNSSDGRSTYLLYDEVIDEKVKRFDTILDQFRSLSRADIVHSNNKVQLLGELNGILSSKYPTSQEES